MTVSGGRAMVGDNDTSGRTLSFSADFFPLTLLGVFTRREGAQGKDAMTAN